MKIYKNIYIGTNVAIAEKRNFLEVIQQLTLVKIQGDSFVLISSSHVFDMSKTKKYSEASDVSPVSKTMRFLVEAEKKVLQYERGYVFRIHGLITDYNDLFVNMSRFEGIPKICHESEWLLSKEAYDYLLLYYQKNAGVRKIIHFVSGSCYEMSDVWVRIRNLAYYEIVNGNPDFVFNGCSGRLVSEVLACEYFHEDFVRENKNSVNRYLRSFSLGGV